MRKRKGEHGRGRERRRNLTPIAPQPDADADDAADPEHHAAERPRSGDHRDREPGDEPGRPNRCGWQTPHQVIVAGLPRDR